MPDLDTSTFHMVQLSLDARRLAALGKMLNLPLRRVRTNYLVHCALGELFKDAAPKPFSLEDSPKQLTEENGSGRHVRVLGYSGVNRMALNETARMAASPTVYETCHWDRCASKPMPESFSEGIRLGFEVQACPVVRKASAGSAETPNGTRTWKEGEELDAFLSEAWKNPGEDLSRESVYCKWLDRQFRLRGGATLESAGMKQFSVERMARRTQGTDRKVRTFKRPDVTLTGTLTVTDSLAFTELLKRGIGQHKSFGYGMLKVRPAA